MIVINVFLCVYSAVLKGLKVSATARLAEDPMGALVLKELKIDSWDYTQVSVR